MTFTRLLIKKGDVRYRFLLLERKLDGSLLVFLDRSARSANGAGDVDEQGRIVPISGLGSQPRPAVRFSIHPTGRVNCHYLGTERTIFIEPLSAMQRGHTIGLVSIPDASRLDIFDNTDTQTQAVDLDLTDHEGARLTFEIKLSNSFGQPESSGIVIDYGVYAAAVRLVDTPEHLTGIGNRFAHGFPISGQFAESQVAIPESQIDLFRAEFGEGPMLLRERSGAYVFMTDHRMRTSPTVHLTFERDDLSAEQVPFEYTHQPTHKVRFWICDRGGRISVEDFADQITSITLDAEF